MSKPWRSRMLRALTVTSGLTVSGLALWGLVAVSESRLAERPSLAPEPSAPASVSAAMLRKPDLVAAQSPIAQALDDKPVMHKPAVPIAPDAAPKVAEAQGISVPDFKGKRLSQVMRKAKELGLRVVARDEYGNRITAQDAAYYRVRKQVTAPGTQLPPKGQLEVRVREVVDYAAGY